MNCPQCNADLQESATFCYKCGSPVRPAFFSYLPPGTPPWPTSVPRQPASRSEAATPTMQSVAAATAKPQSRPKRSAAGVLSIVALLIFTPILGAALTLGVLYANGQFPPRSVKPAQVVVPPAQPSPAATGTPNPSASSTPSSQSNLLPTPTSFQTATNSQMSISIKYPSDWIADPAQTNGSGDIVIDFRSQQVPVELAIEKFSAATSAQLSSTTMVNQSVLQGFSTAQGVSNFQLLTNTPRQLQAGNITWDEQDANFQGNGTLFHLVSLTVKHGKIYYNIIYYAPEVAYQEAIQKYFQPMLSSFKFLSNS